MGLQALSNGKVSGTNSYTPVARGAKGWQFGGALITTNGSDAVTVTCRKNDGSGAIVFQVITVFGGFFAAPIEMGGATAVHTVVSGTGGEAMFYQWTE